jgi:hypothetical protein
MQPSGGKFVKGVFRIFVKGFGVIFMALFPGRRPSPASFIDKHRHPLYIVCT